jgi:protein tyrosine phosphatase (PTP) superfamily phosphohydrolase (DUF442 family)
MMPLPVKLALSALVLATLALFVAAAIYLRWVHLDHRLTVIDEGRVYLSAAMPPATLLRFAERYQIDTVIDLRGDPDEAPLVERERVALASAGVRHIHVPATQTPTRDVIDDFVRHIARERAAGRRVLIHCHHGEGRAVFFGALYRVAVLGWSGEEAYRNTHRLPRSLSFLTRLWPGLSRLSPRNPKSELLRELPRQEVAAVASG